MFSQEISGIRYSCSDCVDINFCYKCFGSRRRIHADGHSFEEIGPEFESESTDGGSEASMDQDRRSDSDDESDTDSDGGYSSGEDD